MKNFRSEIDKRISTGLLRNLPQLSEKIDFLSNDYLGLAEIIVNFEGKNGSTGSRLLSGNYSEIEALEKLVSNFHHAEAALIFNSGYNANLGLLSCIASRTDTIIMDQFCHASLIDGAILSHAKRIKFKHNSLHDLEVKLKNSTGNKFVVTEGVFSMDGTMVNVPDMLKICNKYDAILVLDEAHSAGIFGKNGRGLGNELAKENNNSLIRVITYGKAFGTHGAAILCSKEIKDYLVNFSRPFIYSTAPPPHQIHGIKQSYKFMQNSNGKRDKLLELIYYWKEKRPTDLNWIDSESQIQSMITPGNNQVIKLADFLQNQGFSVLPIRKPTVNEGKERIRFCIHAYNTKEQIDLLFSKLKNEA